MSVKTPTTDTLNAEVTEDALEEPDVTSEKPPAHMSTMPTGGVYNQEQGMNPCLKNTTSPWRSYSTGRQTIIYYYLITDFRPSSLRVFLSLHLQICWFILTISVFDREPDDKKILSLTWQPS